MRKIITLIIIILSFYSNLVVGQETQYKTVFFDFEEFEYAQCLELNEIDDNFFMENEGNPGCQLMITDNDSYSGVKCLKLQSDLANELTQCMADATLKLKLDNQSSYKLKFNYKHHFEIINKVESMPCEEGDILRNQGEDDGIYFSDDDGVNYVKVFDLRDRTNRWEEVNLDINKLCNDFSLELNGAFRIKVQVYTALGEYYNDYQWNICSVEKYFLIDNYEITEDYVSNPKKKVSYAYDEAGNRIGRIVETIITPAPVIKSAQFQPVSEPQENVIEDASIKIAPNPTNGLLKAIVSNTDDDAKFGYKIYDSKGQLIQSNFFYGNGEHPIDLSKQESGMYILYIKRGQSSLVYKIIKQ